MQRRRLINPKQLIPVFLAIVAGVFVLVDLLQSSSGQPNSVLNSIASEVVRWTVILTAFALLAGVLNVLTQHTQRLVRRDSQWIYSFVLLVGFVLVLLVAALGQVQNLGTDPLVSSYVQNLFRYVYTPLSASLLALLAFFGLTAALRALVSRRREAIWLVFVVAIMLFLQLPAASQLPAVGQTVAWVHNYLALAGARGLILGGAIGALVASIRILMGVDRPYLDH